MKRVTLDKPAILGGRVYPKGAEVYVASDAVLEAGYKQAARDLARQTINQEAGTDAEALLGTTSDAALLALHRIYAVIVALAEAKTIADVATMIAPFKDEADRVAAAVTDGGAKLPPLEKGVNEAIGDILDRATAVSRALAR